MPSPEQIPEVMSEATKQRWAAKRKKLQGEFIRGPISLAWLCAACGLSANAIRVGMALQFRKGIDKGRPSILSRHLLARFHVSRRSGYRALDELEAAGLVTVDRQRGRAPRVTIKTLENHRDDYPTTQNPSTARA